MNIFVTDKCPIKSASSLDDKRVIKMILESCQMLNTVLVTKVGPEHGMGYKPTHAHHPCTIWAGKSTANYTWLCLHMQALCDEYTKRYAKIHACEKYISYFINQSISLNATNNEITPFVNCTADFKDEKNLFTAYQKQLNTKWDNDKRQPTWYGATTRVQF